MKRRSDRFTIRINDLNHPEVREFSAGRDFRLSRETICRELRIDLTPRVVDLLRFASSIYVADRLVKRNRNGGAKRWTRRILCSIEVIDAEFWNRESVKGLVKDALQFVTGDLWELEFTQDRKTVPRRDYLPFRADSYFDSPPVVCLYSGGLDSAAGLARRFGDRDEVPIIPVSVRHRPDITKKVTKQLGLLERVFRTQIRPVCTALSMISPKRLIRSEETSQRARGLLFASVGGAVAAATGASEVEMYESGIGAINAPLLAGMEGSQATRSAHPGFLQRMSRLLTMVVDRKIDVVLPFKHLTKGELVKSLNSDHLRELARSTVSCVSYPLRQRTHKSCGLCAACIFRRVALNAAGISEAGDTYQFDVLDRPSVSPKKMNYLKAFLNQVDSLAETDSGRLPVSISKHLYQTGLVARGASMDFYVDLYRRYRQEWLTFVTEARLNGCRWSHLIDLPPRAA